MAEKKSYVYEIIIDTKKGTASINGAAVGLDKLEGKLRQVQKEADMMGTKLSQGASKAGLAGAAIVEMGRTISDANYGMVAMTNNIQQLSTLLVTLVATTGGVRNAFALLKSQLLGPLGLIILFQILLTVIERFSLNNRTAKKTVDKLKTSQEALAFSTRELTDDMRKQLKVSKDLNNSEAQRLLNQVLALEIERTRAEINLGKLEEEEKLQKKLDEFYGRDSKDNPRIQSIKEEIDEYSEQINRLRGLILGKGDKDSDRPEVQGAELWDDPELSFFSELFDIDVQEQLQATALESLDQFYKDKNILDQQATSEEGRLSLARREYARLEAEQRNMSMAFIGDGIQSLGEIIGDQTEAGKAVAAAGAIISTYAAVTKALNTPGLGLARIPYAISVGAFGLAQVARIYQTNVRGNNRSAGIGGGEEARQYNPSFNVVGGSRIDQLNDTIRGELGKPARAYVVNKDVRSAGELERNIRNQGTVSG